MKRAMTPISVAILLTLLIVAIAAAGIVWYLLKG